MASSGESASSAIFATETYTAAANGHPAPYTLTMQTVLSPLLGWSHSSHLTQGPHNSDTCVRAQDCNLVLYEGNAPSKGASAATAVYYSATYGDGSSCSLLVSSAAGGSFAVVDATGAVLYQRPPPPPPPPPPCTTMHNCAAAYNHDATLKHACTDHYRAAAYNHDATLEHACTVHYRAAAHNPNATTNHAIFWWASPQCRLRCPLCSDWEGSCASIWQVTCDPCVSAHRCS